MVADNEMEAQSVKIAHLAMLQGVIGRMGANSFALKALSVSFASAAIAVLASVDRPSLYYAVAAVVPIVMFWLMDAQYLRYERGYRELFDRVRRNHPVDPYHMDASPFMEDIPHVMRLAISWSVFWFYFIILISVGVVAVLIFNGS